MKTTIIIPDVHLRFQLVDRLLKHEQPDEVVYVGDFFDNFGDNPAMNRRQAIWLKAEMKKANRRFCWGNHDIHYAHPVRMVRCSGFSEDKSEAINQILMPEDWAHFKWFHWVDDWLVSHAGVHPYLIPQAHRDPLDPTWFKGWLEAEAHNADRGLIELKEHDWFRAGLSRGGRAAVGGLTWCDFNDEFQPINGISQIVGHTPQIPRFLPRKIEYNNSTNWCIDTHNKHYGWLVDGRLEIKTIPDELMRYRNVEG